MIGHGLGISPRTVELHRAQVMSRLNATNLTELLQIALGAGVAPLSRVSRQDRPSIEVGIRSAQDASRRP
jgi:hypothetical protein